MVKDSVREELALKISPLAKSVKKSFQEKPVREKAAAPVKPSPTVEAIKPAPAIQAADASLPTTEISAKPTSPILVEFQNKNAVIPEWRLQLQNSVRRRNSSSSNGGGQVENLSSTPQKVVVTKGATALKAEPIEQTAAIVSANPTLENALRRIEKSRQKYFTEEKPKLSAVAQNQSKTFPRAVPNKPQKFSANKIEAAEISTIETKPKSPVSLNPVKFESPVKSEKFDTNKLPPIPAKVSSSFEKTIEIPPTDAKIEKDKNNLLEIKADKTPDVVAYQETATVEALEIAEDEADDRAPMMQRFNAGFFDLIIGAFLSVILLAPFTLANGNLFTFQGLLAFLATCSIVMFIYLTTTIGAMGRTLGMKLFSLELVDIEENAYPTFHQAAVSSSVYLVSLALGGIGFLTLFLNDEKRAAHDLISGTIVVKEYE